METNYPDIAHRYDYATIQRAGAYWDRFVAKTFERIDVNGLERLASLAPDTSVVLTSDHRSHLDYVLLALTLYHANLPPRINGQPRPLAIAAGDNLFKRFGKWDFGDLIRRLGAYKIIRKPAEGEKKRVLLAQAAYTAERMDAGDWFLLFPGKGRSYSGELMPFDTGAVGLFLHAERKVERPVAYVPVSISYERSPEDRWFRGFSAYKAQNEPSWSQQALYYGRDWPMIWFQQHFNKSLGNANIAFGQPVTSTQNGTRHTKESLTELLEHEAARNLVAYPTAIFAAALQRDPTFEHVYGHVYDLQSDLRLLGAVDKVRNPHAIAFRALRFLDAPWRRFVVPRKDRYEIRRPEVIDYYANTIKHHIAKCHVPTLQS
ncbi:1-acyl-sn-glycerol-3-phosphate acyltransferase [Candidatus Woesearchaeota archaeon]|nr:1-acyl-sn-glycerol-3-phosphate acyltransferase [Candidatus Woesearchaeota archaeon]